MSDSLANYTFLPWLRQGIANKIQSTDLDTSVKTRAKITVDLTLKGDKVGGGELSENISRNVDLYGPGDIIGIDTKAIIKTEPRNWITNFEPNYLAFIDFYDEDFPWRYTPATPNNSLHRLRPWLALVVLKEDEFENGKNIKDKPLPFIMCENAAALFPAADQLWAWAHVQANRSLTANDGEIQTTNMAAVIPKFQNLLNSNPDLAFSRIVCPRKLEENAAYHAFLVPVFENGRLAGLGLEQDSLPDEIHATFSAWADYPAGTKAEPNHYPYYHRWFFRTGAAGDFEYLVRLLKPRPVDSRVGRRDMDVQYPGSNVEGIKDADLGGILKLGGALKIPFESLKQEDKDDVDKYNNWANPYPHVFQSELAGFINLQDDYANDSLDPSDPDPIITAPLYGRWHALTSRLLKERNGSDIPQNDNWVHDLNLDPRWRVAAGYGTKIVQENQEEYMDAAWSQVGDILEANRKIRQAQLAREVASIWHVRHLKPLITAAPERLFVLQTPIYPRIMVNTATAFHQVRISRVPHCVAAPPLRRITRVRGRTMRLLPADTPEINPGTLIERINNEEVTPAPPKVTPESLPTLDDLAESEAPQNVPNPLLDWTKNYPWLKWLLLGLVLLIFLLLLIFMPSTSIIVGGGFVIGALLWLYRLITREETASDLGDAVREDNLTPESVDDLPKSPDFKITEADDPFTATPTPGGDDSDEGKKFKDALKENYEVIQVSNDAGKVPELPKLDIPAVIETTFTKIDPEITIPGWTMGPIAIPPFILQLIGETFKEAMAYPEFDIPMYKPLVDISADLFLPNINFIEQNSISLLETNQQFIESYMVGLNHEFARELLWREYPTDQRGSYFRQFWDPSSYLDTEGLEPDALKEKLKDIPPLHRWSKYKSLGDFDHREQGGTSEEEVVLVIRGELLKKYPTAVIYAHKAKWQRKTDGSIDRGKPRIMEDLTPAQEDNPPTTIIRTPLYEAKVDPDIYFFGFDLTVEVAQGGTGENEDDDAGWFFIIKERPGEPRFGLDIDGSDDPSFWNDLSWNDVSVENGHIKIANLAGGWSLSPPSGTTPDSVFSKQHQEDVNVSWNANTNSADLAYILYQVPVLVAVHAAEMLPKDE